MFKQNQIVIVDLERYEAWYRANAGSFVWLLDERECYVEAVHSDSVDIHGIQEAVGAWGVPFEFLTPTDRMYSHE